MLETLTDMKPIPLATLAVGVGVGLKALYDHWKEVRRDRNKTDESLSTALQEKRLKPYTELMKCLEKISNTHMRTLAPEQQRQVAREIAMVLHNAIYGEIGLLATTETREVILCARSQCAQFAAAQATYEEMRLAIWAIHQMLRADLNLHQHKVQRDIDRIRSGKGLPETQQENIEKLIRDMPHIEWPTVAQRAEKQAAQTSA